MSLHRVYHFVYPPLMKHIRPSDRMIEGGGGGVRMCLGEKHMVLALVFETFS
jgi:hypothetical protein